MPINWGNRIFSSRGEDRRWRVYRSQAIRRLEEATELQPDMIPAYLMIARLNALPGGDSEKAKEAVESAIKLADDGEDKSKALYMRATLTDDDEQRIADLNKAIEIDPNNMDANPGPRRLTICNRTNRKKQSPTSIAGSKVEMPTRLSTSRSYAR